MGGSFVGISVGLRTFPRAVEAPVPDSQSNPWDTSKSKFFWILSILEYMRLDPDIDISSDVMGVKDPVQDFLRMQKTRLEPDI